MRLTLGLRWTCTKGKGEGDERWERSIMDGDGEGRGMHEFLIDATHIWDVAVGSVAPSQGVLHKKSLHKIIRSQNIAGFEKELEPVGYKYGSRRTSNACCPNFFEAYTSNSPTTLSMTSESSISDECWGLCSILRYHSIYVDVHTIHNHQLVRWGGIWLAFHVFWPRCLFPKIPLQLQQCALCCLI